MQGFTYIPDALEDSLHNKVCKWLEKNKEFKPITSSENSRRVLQFGKAYNYSKKKTDAPIIEIPEIIMELIDSLEDHMDFKKSAREYFTQVLINRYEPGQGISAHIDSKEFKGTIVCFTLGSGCEMEFTRGEEIEKHYVEPNSLYIMQGECRNEWKHAMKARKKDGDRVRDTRYSITMRGIK